MRCVPVVYHGISHGIKQTAKTVIYIIIIIILRSNFSLFQALCRSFATLERKPSLT